MCYGAVQDVAQKFITGVKAVLSSAGAGVRCANGIVDYGVVVW